jgi:microcystin-dependent protein
MAFNGTGTFVRIYNWATDKINSVPITASRMDTEIDAIATGLSNCLTKDGQTTVTANIPMASHKFTGLSVGNARTDSLTLGQVQDGQFTALGLTGGAADAYTATPSPAIIAYVATMQYSAKIHATNLTTTPTLLISAISGGTIKKLDASKAEVEVEASDMLVNGFYNFKRNVANDAWILLNPEKAYYNLINSYTSGLVSTFAMNTPPSGWLECNGAAISRSTYSVLFSAISTTWGVGDGSTTFNIPDLRGEFIRGWDNGRGIDSGRAFASSQNDTFQGHHHQMYASSTGAGGGSTDFRNNAASQAAQSNITAREAITDGTNGTPRTSTETRPRNLALMYCIKY